MRLRTAGFVLAGLATLVFAGSAPADAYVTVSSTITAVAGDGVQGFSGDGGPAAAALLNEPRDTAVAPDGSLYVTDTFNNRIRRIDPKGVITTVAGTGSTTYNGDGIAASHASLYWPHDVVVGPDGTVYIADSNHHRIRKIAPATGVISTVAGTGVAGSSGDGGPATKAQLKNPKTVFVSGHWLYTAGLDNKVRRIDLTTGIISLVAGTGASGYGGDGGPATAALLNEPQRLQVDSAGNVYVADTSNSRIRRIDPRGIITTIAGTGTSGYSGDGGPATAAALQTPRGIALEGDRYLYVADSNNQRIRRVDLRSGIINRVAGSARGYAGDGGPAGDAEFYQPRGLTVLPNGDLVVADTFNSAIRVIKDVKVTGTPSGP